MRLERTEERAQKIVGAIPRNTEKYNKKKEKERKKTDSVRGKACSRTLRSLRELGPGYSSAL